MKENNIPTEIILPTTNQLEKELAKEIYKYQYKRLLKSTIHILIIVIAISSLISNLLFPVLEIHGNSMEPNLTENNIVVALKKKTFKQGDIIAFYYNNHILVKRIIATSMQWVNIDNDGNVFINGELLTEPYLKNKSLGDTNIEFPYQVPEGSYFVLGDKRDTSIDSRNSKIGTISNDEIIGKIFFIIWPLKSKYS